MKKLLFLVFIISISHSLEADMLGNVIIKDVMAGSSSGSQDAAWFRVDGLIGHSNCQYAPANVTLFYATNDGPLSADKALSLLMAAHLSGRTVSMDYSPYGIESDFWGFGISGCQIHRLTIS